MNSNAAAKMRNDKSVASVSKVIVAKVFVWLQKYDLFCKALNCVAILASSLELTSTFVRSLRLA